MTYVVWQTFFFCCYLFKNVVSPLLFFPNIFHPILQVNNINTVCLYLFLYAHDKLYKIITAWYSIAEINYSVMLLLMVVSFTYLFPVRTILQYKNLRHISLCPIFIISKILRSGIDECFFQMFSMLIWIALQKGYFSLNIHEPFSPPAISVNALLKFFPGWWL